MILRLYQPAHDLYESYIGNGMEHSHGKTKQVYLYKLDSKAFVNLTESTA